MLILRKLSTKQINHKRVHWCAFMQFEFQIFQYKSPVSSYFFTNLRFSETVLALLQCPPTGLAAAMMEVRAGKLCEKNKKKSLNKKRHKQRQEASRNFLVEQCTSCVQIEHNMKYRRTVFSEHYMRDSLITSKMLYSRRAYISCVHTCLVSRLLCSRGNDFSSKQPKYTFK